MGGFVKRSRGVNVYFKIENPEGERIQEFFADGSRLKKDKTYTVAFVTEQGVPEKFGINRRDLNIKAIDALKNYLREKQFDQCRTARRGRRGLTINFNMTQEDNTQTGKTENDKTNEMPSLKKRILGWLGYLAVFAAILFFMAPESWWQFGVAPVEGRKAAANFSLQTLDGAKWNFSEHRGKVVVINYWATWCPPCRVETPGLVSFADEYKTRGVETIGVTVDEDLSLVPPFVEKYGIKYPILAGGYNPNLAADGMALPTTFLYDKNGNLAKKYTGIVLESTLRSDADALLAE